MALKSLAGYAFLLLFVAWAARQAYELLLPLVPAASVFLGLVLLFALFVRLRRSR